MLKRRQFLGNSFSMLVNRLAQSIATFVLVAAIARILGPYELGQYTLAFSYYFLFMTIASQGLKVLFTRELSKHPEELPTYLVNGTVLQVLFSLIGYIALLVVVWALPYGPDTTAICYLLGLMIFPFSLSNVTESIFQAQEKMHLIAISTVPIYLTRLVLMILAMQQGYGLITACSILIASEVLILLVQWGLMLRLVKPRWRIDWTFIQRLIRMSWAFLGIEGMAVFNIRVQVVILSVLGGEAIVGLYGAVLQLLQPFDILSHSLVLAIFPGMSKTVALGRQKQRQLVENVIEILLLSAVPIAIGATFIGQDLLMFVYSDPGFADAGIVLTIVAWSLLISSFLRPISFLLLANGFERVNLYEQAVNTSLGTVLGAVIIAQFQLIGAAAIVPLRRLISFSMYLFVVYKHLFKLQWWTILRRPLLLSAVMVTVFVALQHLHFNILLTVVTATSAYIVAMGLLGLYAFGGPGAVRDRLLRSR